MPWPVFIPIGLVAAFVLFGIGRAIARAGAYVDPRPGELAALAQRYAFTFDPATQEGRPAWGEPFSVFNFGTPVEMKNRMAGVCNGLDTEILDYTYYTERKNKDGKTRRSYTTVTVVAVRMPQVFPALQLAPDSGFREFLEFLGGRDIDFESNEFNKRFYVKSPDRKFAYDVIHPRMMTYLLETREAFRGISMQIVADRAVLQQYGRLDAAEIDAVLQFALGFYERIPDYIKEDYAAKPDPDEPSASSAPPRETPPVH